MLIVTIGGWDVLQGAKAVQIAYILIYLIMAFFVAGGTAASSRSPPRSRSSW